MVTEFAEFEVKPEETEAFIAWAAAGKAMLLQAAACHGVVLHRSVENPAHFVLAVEWDSVTAHHDCRATAAFQAWRAKVGPFFAGQPHAWHGEAVI